MYNSKQSFPLEIDLLYFENKDVEVVDGNNELKTHYCLINNLSRLLSTQMNDHDHKIYFCKRCLNAFNSQIILDSHKLDCNNFQAVK